MRKLLHKPLLLLMRSKRNFDLKTMGEINLNKVNCPAIFVVNHTNSHDIPVASEVIKKHHHVLLGKQPLEFIDKIAFWLNGVIWVDRKNKGSKAQAKEKMISVLENGTNLLMFPEGTWNRSPNKIMLPLYWGGYRYCERKWRANNTHYFGIHAECMLCQNRCADLYSAKRRQK